LIGLEVSNERCPMTNIKKLFGQTKDHLGVWCSWCGEYITDQDTKEKHHDPPTAFVKAAAGYAPNWTVSVHAHCHRGSGSNRRFQQLTDSKTDFVSIAMERLGIVGSNESAYISTFNLEIFRRQMVAMITRGFNPQAITLAESALLHGNYSRGTTLEIERLAVWAATGINIPKEIRKRAIQRILRMRRDDAESCAVASNFLFGIGDFKYGLEYQRLAEENLAKSVGAADRLHLAVATRRAQFSSSPKDGESAILLATSIGSRAESQYVTTGWSEVFRSNEPNFYFFDRLVDLPNGARWVFRADALAARVIAAGSVARATDESTYAAMCTAQLIYSLSGSSCGADIFSKHPDFRKSNLPDRLSCIAELDPLATIPSDMATTIRKRILGHQTGNLPTLVSKFIGFKKNVRLQDQLSTDWRNALFSSARDQFL
jgi:hypothetical protein